MSYASLLQRQALALPTTQSLSVLMRFLSESKQCSLDDVKASDVLHYYPSQKCADLARYYIEAVKAAERIRVRCEFVRQMHLSDKKKKQVTPEIATEGMPDEDFEELDAASLQQKKRYSLQSHVAVVPPSLKTVKSFPQSRPNTAIMKSVPDCDMWVENGRQLFD